MVVELRLGRSVTDDLWHMYEDKESCYVINFLANVYLNTLRLKMDSTMSFCGGGFPGHFQDTDFQKYLQLSPFVFICFKYSDFKKLVFT